MLFETHRLRILPSRIGLLPFLVLFAILLSSVSAAAQTVTVAWNRNTEPDVVRYRVYWGLTSGSYTSSADAGNNTEYTITGLTVEKVYYAAVRAENSDGLLSEFSSPLAFIALGPVPPGPRYDFNQDGRPDLIWHHSTDGYVAAWMMTGERLNESVLTSPGRVADTNWKPVGTGDFNRDGHPDIVWQHQTQGYVAIWLMNGTTLIESVGTTPDRVSDTRWRIAGISDINGDGYSDFIWQERTEGWLAAWIMNGTRLDISRGLAPERVHPDWQIRASADINGDMRPDLIWQNVVDGSLSAWIMNGINVVEGRGFTPDRVADTRWKIVGAADVNGDGHTDIYWRDDTTGSLVVWLMAYSQLRTSIGLTPDRVADLGWKVIGVR